MLYKWCVMYHEQMYYDTNNWWNDVLQIKSQADKKISCVLLLRIISALEICQIFFLRTDLWMIFIKIVNSDIRIKLTRK